MQKQIFMSSLVTPRENAERQISPITCSPARLKGLTTCWKAILWALLLSVVGSDVVLADKATDDFDLGLGFYREKRWEQAEETLGQFLTDYPDHPRANTARLYYARSLSVLEKYELARTEFSRFIVAEPTGKDVADAQYRLGECSYFLKDYSVAIDQLTIYLNEHPMHSLNDWAKLLLGDSCVVVRQYSKAVDILTPLTTLPNNTSIVGDARFSLGKALEGLNQIPEALEQYKAVATEKNSAPAPRALNRVAAIHYASGQYKDSAAAFEQLVQDYPGTSLAASATLGTGMAWYRAGEYDKALEWLGKVPPESASRPQATMLTAMSLKELGRIEESRQSFASALKAAGNSLFAADVLFQQAQMERTAGSKELAAQIFEDIPDRWSDFKRASECLFNASELRLELTQYEHAERLWTRLRTSFPEAAARPREQVLLGRLFLARGESEKSISTLQKATEQISDPKDRVAAVGRYYLVRAFYEAKKPEQVIEQTLLMNDAFQLESLREVRGALALAAVSSLQLERYEDVIRFADQFLPLAQDEKQKADVTAARVVALSHLKRFPEASADLDKLIKDYPDESQTWTAVLQAAEAALEQNSPAEAADFFALAAKFDKDPEVREAGLTGVAWSQFKAEKYPLAETSFAKIVEDYPASEDLGRTLFMKARCVEEQGDKEKTAAAYSEVFEKLTRDQLPASHGSEETPPLQFAFDAGRQAARLLEKIQRIDDADKAWEKLVTQFPKAKGLDRILDEWAWMNITAERFQQSDAIHRRIVDEFPDSPFAGQARLSIAESQLEAGQMEAALKEMEAIVADVRYGVAEKERALFHVIEIHAALRHWPSVTVAAEQFLAAYNSSPLAPQVRLFSGNAMVEQQKPEEATKVLSTLRDEIVAGKIASQDWTDRVWIVLGEAALAARNYDQIDQLETELLGRSSQSAFAFQMMDLQGRRWKQQAPPDFQKARDYFSRVTSDQSGQGTETAARCQFLIAETHVLEMKLEEAVKEYFKVYLNYSYNDLRAQALFQAALCESRLKKTDAALRDFRELTTTFPESPLAEKARAEIKTLGGSAD